MKNLYPLFLLLVASSFLCSCATLVHGPYQKFVITADPKVAEVYIDGHRFGNTPTVVRMTRWKNHRLELRLEGYKPYELQLKRKLDAWAFGNIALGGPLGIGIDALSGAMYRLTPKDIYPTLTRNRRTGAESLAIFITLKPEAGWVKIGMLTKDPDYRSE
jgi:hypothetical protein